MVIYRYIYALYLVTRYETMKCQTKMVSHFNYTFFKKRLGVYRRWIHNTIQIIPNYGSTGLKYVIDLLQHLFALILWQDLDRPDIFPFDQR